MNQYAPGALHPGEFLPPPPPPVDVIVENIEGDLFLR
jgi:hypothetical protein